MKTQRRKLLSGVWLAFVAVLATALMPTVAQALAHSRGEVSQWAEVCTAQGLNQVSVLVQDQAGPEAEAALQTANPRAYCAYCVQSSPLAPPLVAVAGVYPQALGRLLPAQFLPAPGNVFACCSAQPRAPPSRA